ncbi:dienelactone hydrolase family protein [Massilia horti]|uniref:Dienelactone hydrolase n=1 Tax=Massilia horti TaxID=2562153 RepID=A0A4Y9T5L3_9BURK|nr:dienelactone hydrolase family protein [Massilia horti]TFW32324.1 dienelactone hydrolase [Massilia horti]
MNKLLIAFLLCAATAASAADIFTFSNPPGPHAVGLKVIQQYDRTRLYKAPIDLVTGEPVQGERTRPIQALVWYPATPESGSKPVTYRDYLETVPTEDAFTLSAAEVKRLTDNRIDDNAGARRAALLREVSRAMHAVRDAHPKAGRFPVVIYAPSYSAYAIENADLCEYLASQGYIVLSSPSLGAHTRAMTIDLDGAETQASDIAYLIGYAATLPAADTSKVGVVGFSWGGLANVFAAAKDERIRALVSLDGSLRGSPEFVDGGKDAAKYVTPARVAVPLLYLGARPRTVEELNSNVTPTHFSFMNEMKYSDVYIVSVLPMKHGDFSSYSIRMSQDGSFGDYTREEIALAHSWAALYTRHFLDAYLKGDAAGLTFVNNTPATNRAPAHMLTTSIRRNQSNPAPTLENFVRLLTANGFDRAIPLYKQMSMQPNALKLGPNEVFAWGLQLYRLNRLEQAREIFRLGAHLHPDLAFIVSALAETQAKTGQTREAFESYRRVIELDPSNADAMKYLKEHASSSS